MSAARRAPRGDTVERVLAFNADREPERRALKYAAMCRDPFVFLRGTAHLFADAWSDAIVAGDLAAAPNGWVCGDLHLENFGTFHGENRLVYFDVNDFDEAALAPVTIDLARFLTSLHLAADQLGLGRGVVRTLAADYAAAYTQALVRGKPFWVERSTARGAIRHLLKLVKSRSRQELVESRTVDGRCRQLKTDGRRYLPASDMDRQIVERDLGAFAVRVERPDFFRVLDVARRVAGTGSLGVARYAVLVHGPDRGPPRLLDLKEARPSVVAAAAKRLGIPARRWESDAHRVTTVQRAAQAVTPSLLLPIDCDGRGFIVRSLQPSEDRLSLDALAAHPKRLRRAVETMARVTAWMHLRTAGRWRAATVERWHDWASDPRWTAELSRFAERRARQTTREWAAFARAHGRHRGFE
ncbi:MAG TPA: DUF2252 family protein [Gemmatimonadaceae bacterium]|nr:DUF2252 family protein [Gemmatimonadaceae bacterium]